MIPGCVPVPVLGMFPLVQLQVTSATGGAFLLAIPTAGEPEQLAVFVQQHPGAERALVPYSALVEPPLH